VSELLKESEIQQRIRIVLNKAGALTRVWRNNVGQYKKGNAYIKYGLCVGSADLVGVEKVVITPEMVGQTIGRFLAVEVKTPSGRLSPEQKAWLETIRSYGGRAVVFRSKDDAVTFLEEICAAE
jgi:hypothetical protein